jgi:hypothetical protein
LPLARVASVVTVVRVRKETDHEVEIVVKGIVPHVRKETDHEARVETEALVHKASDLRAHKGIVQWVIDHHVHRESAGIVPHAHKETEALVHKASDLRAHKGIVPLVHKASGRLVPNSNLLLTL